jgi:ribosome biogenesis protein BMS1
LLLNHAAVQVHGFPKVMGVLTHLDGFKEPSRLKKAKKALKVIIYLFVCSAYHGLGSEYLSGFMA